MFIPEIQRHLAVCSLAELPELLKCDPEFWHVVSIRDPEALMADAPRALSVHYTAFEDCEGQEGLYETLATFSQLEAVFEYVDAHPEQPILVHCQAGLSRSTAVALAIITRGLFASGLRNEDLCHAASEILLAIRPRARPNLHVLRLGLRQFLDTPTAITLGEEILMEPRLLANRFVI